MTPFKELDPVLHSQLRLAIMSLLVTAESASFTWLQEETGATAGNLSVQLSKLKEAGYVQVTKGFKENYPHTLCRITPLGKEKFEEYVKSLEDYIKPSGQS